MTEYIKSQNTPASVINLRRISFVVVSGLPASGKTTLARKLSSALALSLLDKDDILEGLFDALGTGDTEWRQRLSRASDEIFQRLANSSCGAVLTSFWRHPELSSVSGTPTDWITKTSHQVIEVYCKCDPEVAAGRFVNRKRHSGHLDSVKRLEDVVSDFRTLAAMGPLGVGKLLQVDTSHDVNIDSVVGELEALVRHS